MTTSTVRVRSSLTRRAGTVDRKGRASTGPSRRTRSRARGAVPTTTTCLSAASPQQPRYTSNITCAISQVFNSTGMRRGPPESRGIARVTPRSYSSCPPRPRRPIAVGLGEPPHRPLYGEPVEPNGRSPWNSKRRRRIYSEDLGDGNWHRITIHAKMSSTPAARDGFLYGWIDGNLKWSNPAYPTGNAGGWDYFQTPTVLNSGSPIAQSEWLDNLVVGKP